MKNNKRAWHRVLRGTKGLFALCSLMKGIPRPPLNSKFLKFDSNLWTHIHGHLMIKGFWLVFGVKIVGIIWEILQICFINQRYSVTFLSRLVQGWNCIFCRPFVLQWRYHMVSCSHILANSGKWLEKCHFLLYKNANSQNRLSWNKTQKLSNSYFCTFF